MGIRDFLIALQYLQYLHFEERDLLNVLPLISLHEPKSPPDWPITPDMLWLNSLF
jgi:hypothetical protein